MTADIRKGGRIALQRFEGFAHRLKGLDASTEKILSESINSLPNIRPHVENNLDRSVLCPELQVIHEVVPARLPMVQ